MFWGRGFGGGLKGRVGIFCVVYIQHEANPPKLCTLALSVQIKVASYSLRLGPQALSVCVCVGLCVCVYVCVWVRARLCVCLYVSKSMH